HTRLCGAREFDIKYCSAVNPSLKFEMIGVSMISPEGLAIRPRMPASWRICAGGLRAPEGAIMEIDFTWPSRPFLSFLTDEISFIISSAIWSVDFDQASTTLL